MKKKEKLKGNIEFNYSNVRTIAQKEFLNPIFPNNPINRQYGDIDGSYKWVDQTCRYMDATTGKMGSSVNDGFYEQYDRSGTRIKGGNIGV